MSIEIKNWADRVLFSSETVEGLAGADLEGARLVGADLKDANFEGACLIGANLKGACLAGANLKGANLAGACLVGSNLAGANLTGVSLTGANLTDANIAGVNLTNSNIYDVMFTGCLLTPEQLGQLALHIPCVEDLDQKVLAAVTVEGGHLDMSRWHGSDRTAATCGSTHCRAGWAIHLAGSEGYALEDVVGPVTAGALIYLKSTGQAVPDFMAFHAPAMADIQRRAQVP